MALKVKVGDAFPPFSLPDQRGQPVSSQGFSGKPAVIYFYPKDNTPGCTTEAQDFTANVSQFLARDVLVYGVSTDTVRSHDQFCQKHRLQISLLSDSDAAFSKQVGVLNPLTGTSRRTTFLLDKVGRVARIWENVTPKGHADEVLATVDRLQGEQKL
jgi:peroxiredoxin Q/BCP